MADAEQLAADWLVYLGYEDARLTGSGPDGGVDVRSARAVAQVKFKAAQIGAPDLQRRFGARGASWEQDLFFFSGTTFSAKALAYAEEHEISLFTYDLTGAVRPVSTIARVLLSEAERRDARSALPSDAEGSRSTAMPDTSTARPGTGLGASRDLGGRGSRPAAAVSSGGVRAPGPAVQCLLAAVILFVPATLTVVGFGAMFCGPGAYGLVGTTGHAWLGRLAVRPRRRCEGGCGSAAPIALGGSP